MLNIAIAGLGTVGAAVVRLLRANAAMITSHGAPIVIKAVCARDRDKLRDCDLTGIDWIDDPQRLPFLPGIDAVVELVGGPGHTARQLATTALRQGKHVVTANKALIAAHGVELANLAEANSLQLSFEAAAAAGLPVLKVLREGLAANHLTMVGGILNGTCNFILTRMQKAALSFKAALQEAQELGYAEADPASDIDGIDTANKLAILAALAFGVVPDVAAIDIEGIRRLTPLDLQFADELGYRIKLLAQARLTAAGLEQRVAPVLVARTAALAAVDQALNAVLLRGDFVGDVLLQGQGAGGNPTASAVVADLIDLAHGQRRPAFGIPATQLRRLPPVQPPAASYYLRLQAMDKAGAVADIGAILRDEGLSIETLLQRGVPDGGAAVPVVIVTHDAAPAAIQRGLTRLGSSDVVREPPLCLRIERFQQ